MNYKIYSIVYDSKHVSEYTRYDNSHIKTVEQKSYLFEYNPIIDIIDNHDITEEYLGIFSYKFYQKTKIPKKRLLQFISMNSFDFYGFSKHSGNMNLFPGLLEKSHPGFTQIFEPLCKDLKLPHNITEDYIYENFFVTKTSIYKDYVNTIIKPAIELLDTKYKELSWKDAIYKPNPKLFEETGLKHYTFHTFILERLINQYIIKNNFTIKTFR